MLLGHHHAKRQHQKKVRLFKTKLPFISIEYNQSYFTKEKKHLNWFSVGFLFFFLNFCISEMNACHFEWTDSMNLKRKTKSYSLSIDSNFLLRKTNQCLEKKSDFIWSSGKDPIALSVTRLFIENSLFFLFFFIVLSIFHAHMLLDTADLYASMLIFIVFFLLFFSFLYSIRLNTIK